MSSSSASTLPPHPASVWPSDSVASASGSSASGSSTESRDSDDPIPSMASVCVIGAGIAGLSTAAQLSALGVDVVVLDARGVASGATGRSSAKVSVLHETLAQEIAQKDGVETASQYVKANEYGRKWIRQQVKDQSIDCGWSDQRAITYVTEDVNRRRIEDEAAALSTAGVAARVIDLDLPYPTAGAVVVDDQGQFDPVRFVRGLADRLVRQGVRIETGVRATGVKDGSSGATVETTHGTIRARHVIVTTGLPFLDRGLFFARAVPQSSYVVACEVEQLPPEGMYLSADGPKRSLRTATGPDGDTLLLVGGEGHKTGQGGDTLERPERLVAWADQHFGVRSVTNRFMAQDYVTPDRRPFAGPLHPGRTSVLVATGFNKWGFTNAAASAAVLTSHIIESARPTWADAYSTSRLPLSGMGQLLKAGADVQKHLIGRWANALVSNQRSEAKEGEVVGRGLKPVAIARASSSDEKPCAVSGVCTHLGGVVSWNPAEETWDCPLHGSRFEREGSLLHGPAVSDLESVSAT